MGQQSIENKMTKGKIKMLTAQRIQEEIQKVETELQVAQQQIGMWNQKIMQLQGSRQTLTALLGEANAVDVNIPAPPADTDPVQHSDDVKEEQPTEHAEQTPPHDEQ